MQVGAYLFTPDNGQLLGTSGQLPLDTFFLPGRLSDWGASDATSYVGLCFAERARVFLMLPADMREPW